MRLPKIIILLILIFGVTASHAGDRSELHLFKYGRTNTKPLLAAFLDFRDMLAEMLPRLSSKVSRNVTIPAVSKLKLNQITDENGNLLPPSERFGSLAEKRDYWLQTGALSVLTGTIRQRGGVPYVTTTFFWGQLRGAYSDEMIQLELPVSGEAFDSTFDSHSVAILYTLAQEIKQDCSQLDKTMHLLSEAHLRALAITGDFPNLGADLEALVVQAIEEVRHNCSE